MQVETYKRKQGKWELARVSRDLPYGVRTSFESNHVFDIRKELQEFFDWAAAALPIQEHIKLDMRKVRLVKGRLPPLKKNTKYRTKKARRIHTSHGVFDSVTIASKELRLSDGCIRWRAKSKYHPEWYFINDSTSQESDNNTDQDSNNKA